MINARIVLLIAVTFMANAHCLAQTSDTPNSSAADGSAQANVLCVLVPNGRGGLVKLALMSKVGQRADTWMLDVPKSTFSTGPVPTSNLQVVLQNSYAADSGGVSAALSGKDDRGVAVEENFVASDPLWRSAPFPSANAVGFAGCAFRGPVTLIAPKEVSGSSKYYGLLSVIFGSTVATFNINGYDIPSSALLSAGMYGIVNLDARLKIAEGDSYDGGDVRVTSPDSKMVSIEIRGKDNGRDFSQVLVFDRVPDGPQKPADGH